MKNERNRENTNNEYFMVLLSANVLLGTKEEDERCEK
jgi:hypothetical protein